MTWQVFPPKTCRGSEKKGTFKHADRIEILQLDDLIMIVSGFYIWGWQLHWVCLNCGHWFLLLWNTLMIFSRKNVWCSMSSPKQHTQICWSVQFCMINKYTPKWIQCYRSISLFWLICIAIVFVLRYPAHNAAWPMAKVPRRKDCETKTSKYRFLK